VAQKTFCTQLDGAEQIAIAHFLFFTVQWAHSGLPFEQT